MSPRYKEALSEVDYIINLLALEEMEKIPKEFREFITINKDKYYKISNIQELKEETLAILAIIYRKYLVPAEERDNLEKEFQEKLKLEKTKMGNNGTSLEINYTKKIIGENKIHKKEYEKMEHAISQYLEKKWYEKILHKIKSIFKRRGV